MSIRGRLGRLGVLHYRENVMEREISKFYIYSDFNVLMVKDGENGDDNIFHGDS